MRATSNQPHTTPPIIALVTEKGGVGKTTTVFNLGAALGRVPMRVLAIDMDPGAGLTVSIGLTKKNTPSTYSVLHGNTTIKDSIVPWDEIHVVPSSDDLAGFTLEVASAISRERKLQKSLAPSLGDYDVILLDCPPSLDLLTVNAMAAATHLIIPMEPSYLSMEGLSGILNTYHAVRQEINPDLQLLGLLMTRVDVRKSLPAQVQARIREEFGDLVFKTIIRADVRIEEAPSYAQSIFKYAPNGRGVTDFLNLCHEVRQRLAHKKQDKEKTHG